MEPNTPGGCAEANPHEISCGIDQSDGGRAADKKKTEAPDFGCFKSIWSYFTNIVIAFYKAAFWSNMKTVEAKVEENFKEDPESEPDREPNTWLIDGKLDEEIENWENMRLDFRFPEIQAEIIESYMSEANRFTLRTHGKSPLQKGDVIHVDVREQYPE